MSLISLNKLDNRGTYENNKSNNKYFLINIIWQSITTMGESSTNGSTSYSIHNYPFVIMEDLRSFPVRTQELVWAGHQE